MNILSYTCVRKLSKYYEKIEEGKGDEECCVGGGGEQLAVSNTEVKVECVANIET